MLPLGIDAAGHPARLVDCLVARSSPTHHPRPTPPFLPRLRAASAAHTVLQVFFSMPLLGSPFNVEIPEASGGEAGDQSGRGVSTIRAKLLTGASAAQYGEVVFNESALGPLIGTTRCKKRELDTLFEAKGGSGIGAKLPEP